MKGSKLLREMYLVVRLGTKPLLLHIIEALTNSIAFL